MRFFFIAATCIALAAPGFGTTIGFEQGGWSRGGPLHVSFSGVDGDADGSLLLDELLDFSAAWGTPGGGRTVWGIADIEPDGFQFADLGDYLLFLRNPDYSLVSSAFEGEVLSSVFDSLLFPVDTTSSPASAVPEPGCLWLLAAGSVGAIAGRLRKRR
jgi:hypothetical protein